MLRSAPCSINQIGQTRLMKPMHRFAYAAALLSEIFFMLASVVLSDSPSVLPADDRSTDISILAGTDIYLRTYHTALGRMQMPVRAVYSIRHHDY